MRGTHHRPGHTYRRKGIIPAYAGNTYSPSNPRFLGGDHPRVCGEHPVQNSTAFANGGSSPRMRGTLMSLAICRFSPGIIPAYAGNTAIFPTRAFIMRDHPRVCGEHALGLHQSYPTGGSSPRMRGTLHIRLGGHHRNGIIPAYAGNTAHPSGSAVRPRDHPRVCGEHTKRL